MTEKRVFYKLATLVDRLLIKGILSFNLAHTPNTSKITKYIYGIVSILFSNEFVHQSFTTSKQLVENAEDLAI